MLFWTLSIILGILLFSLAVFIHELGHFVVARLLGMRADVFSIGFGPALWKKKIRGTEVRISAIPFGGYVSLPQLDPEGMQKIQGDHSTGEAPLPPVAPWKRILVALAGPMGNVLLALVCAALISWCAPAEIIGSTTEIGIVETGSAADAAGLKAGDKLLRVNGKPIKAWNDFHTECVLAGDKDALVRIDYERNGETFTTEAPLNSPIVEGSDMYKVGGLYPKDTYFGVEVLFENTVAHEAGLELGDEILTVNGEAFTSLAQLTQREDPSAAFTLQVRAREENAPLRTITLQPREEIINPETGEKKWLVGIVPNGIQPKVFPWMAERGVYAQLAGDTYNVVRILEALTDPHTEGERGRAAKNLGGPLMIFNLFIQMVQYGLWVCLGLLRLICVNLAILNLLPIPVLDGGHILFSLYAMITRREPNPKVIGYITNVFALLLLGLMLLLVGVDIIRFF